MLKVLRSLKIRIVLRSLGLLWRRLPSSVQVMSFGSCVNIDSCDFAIIDCCVKQLISQAIVSDCFFLAYSWSKDTKEDLFMGKKKCRALARDSVDGEKNVLIYICFIGKWNIVYLIWITNIYYILFDYCIFQSFQEKEEKQARRKRNLRRRLRTREQKMIVVRQSQSRGRRAVERHARSRVALQVRFSVEGAQEYLWIIVKVYFINVYM